MSTQLEKPCVCVDLIKMQKKENFSDDLAAYISGSVLQAGSETTSGILVGFVQAMVIFPEAAEKAQRELDRVCGDRFPTLDDWPNLPYVRACAKETLRWMPGFFLGIPHAVTQDDMYLGYRIPKGATVILNAWYVAPSLQWRVSTRGEKNAGLINFRLTYRAVHNDPQRHPNPRKFEPMRYIDDRQTSIDAANNPDPTQRDHFVFGAGRRRCQGMHIADRSIYLAISRLLWAFDFRRAMDADTKQEVVPDMDDLVDGMMCFPSPFQANIVPRSAYKAQCVREEWAEVAKLLDEEMQWKMVPEGLVRKDEQRKFSD